MNQYHLCDLYPPGIESKRANHNAGNEYEYHPTDGIAQSEQQRIIMHPYPA